MFSIIRNLLISVNQTYKKYTIKRMLVHFNVPKFPVDLVEQSLDASNQMNFIISCHSIHFDLDNFHVSNLSSRDC